MPSRDTSAKLAQASSPTTSSSDDVTGAHPDAARGDWLAADDLRCMRQQPLEHGRAQAGPDQAGGDVLVGSVALVQVRVRLPFLEQQLRAFFSANDEPSWITMSSNRATAAWPSGARIRPTTRTTSRCGPVTPSDRAMRLDRTSSACARSYICCTKRSVSSAIRVRSARTAGIHAFYVTLHVMTATRIAPYAEDRAALRSLFRLADDSDPEIERYLWRGTILVATEGDAIVGYVQIVDTDVATTCELKSLAVVEAHRGLGLGRQLIEAGLAYARERGATRALIATGAADTHLLRFYQRIGFRMLRVERDAFTPAAGYPADLFVDGIRLLDRVWLDFTL